MPAFDPKLNSVQHAEGKIALDHGNGELSFVSHAHSDHSSFVRKNRRVLASEATVALWEARSKRAFPATQEQPPQGVKLIEAGHVLGARQLLVEGDGESFLYTGDFNAAPSATCPAAQAPRCDTLVLECTYGSPQYSFPQREQVYSQIASWVNEGLAKGENVILGGYSLGKAQELVKVVNERVGAAPLVNDTIAAVCKVYTRFGCFLDCLPMAGEQASKELRGNFVAVLPQHQVTPQLAYQLESYYGRKTRTAVATGWALSERYAGVDEAFALSDHSDYQGLLDFVQRTQASKVYCTHGFEKEFAAALCKRGIDAVALGNFDAKKEKENRSLLEYTTY